jgi:hypothetical protein
MSMAWLEGSTIHPRFLKKFGGILAPYTSALGVNARVNPVNISDFSIRSRRSPGAKAAHSPAGHTYWQGLAMSPTLIRRSPVLP